MRGGEGRGGEKRGEVNTNDDSPHISPCNAFDVH